MLASRVAIPEPLQTSLVAADFDRDGLPDLLSAGSYLAAGAPGAKVNLLYGDGQGGVKVVPGPLSAHLVTSIWGLAEFPAALYPGEVQVADLNGDGRLDVVVSDHSTAVFGISDQYPAQISVLLAQELPAERARDFYTVTPCRLVDTRSGSPIVDNSPTTLQLAGACVPISAKALSVNLTAITPSGDSGFSFYPVSRSVPAATTATSGPASRAPTTPSWRSRRTAAEISWCWRRWPTAAQCISPST